MFATSPSGRSRKRVGVVHQRRGAKRDEGLCASKPDVAVGPVAMPGLASPQVPAIDFQLIAPNAVVSAKSLPRDTIDELYSQYGDPSELMLTRSES